MIFFNNIALEQVAPVKIVDIHVSPISMTVQARQRPVAWGADFVRLTGGSRTINIDFALLTMNRDERQNQLAAITQWAASDTPGKLMLPNRRDAYLECICTGLPEPSLRQWWESKLRLTFKTFDNPYWTSITEKSIHFGNEFIVLGTAPPLMRLEGTVDSAIATNEYFVVAPGRDENGYEVMYFTQIPAGDLKIDLNHQTAAVGNVSIMNYYTFSSSFLRPHTGKLYFFCSSAYVNCSTKWRERWQ